MQEVPLAKVIDPQRLDFEAENMVYLDGIPYGNADGHPLLMDIFYKKDAPKPMPVVLWVHGGGWSDPNLTRKYRPELQLGELARRGFLIASIDYRLCPEFVFPAQIEDCKCAVRYLRAHAQTYGLDPERIGAWGESAGGHLVGLLGATAHVKEFEGTGGWQEYSSAVQAVCDWYGPNDMIKSAQTREGGTDSPLFTKLFGGSFQEKEELIWAASPIRYAQMPMPAYLLMHGDADRLVPYWQSQNYFDALEAAGNDAELITVHGQGHGFFDGEEYYESIYQFFSRVLQ